MSKLIGELPKHYNPRRDWRLIVVGLTAVLAAADVFLLYARDLGLIYSITSAILAVFFAYEVFSRLRFGRTVMGYRFSLYLAIFYIAVDVLIYTVQ